MQNSDQWRWQRVEKDVENGVSGDGNWALVTDCEEPRERNGEGKLGTGSKIERGKDRRRASFALGVIGIISIDPDSLPRFYHLAHHPPSP